MAKAEKLWVSGLKDLKLSIEQLDAVFAGLQAVSERMHTHSEEVFSDPSSRDAQRLANAIMRFSEDLESLRSRWDG